jgi:hypothetical protein
MTQSLRSWVLNRIGAFSKNITCQAMEPNVNNPIQHKIVCEEIDKMQKHEFMDELSLAILMMRMY